MLLWFDRKGQLLEQLEYGQVPYVGTTNFQIFAYVEGVDLTQVQANAMIKLYKPDLHGSSYPVLLMENGRFNYNHNIEESNYFKEVNNPYRGFYFNFNNFNSDTGEVLLDTPGLWKAVITVITSEGFSVQGTATFNVGGTATGQETTLTLDEILSNTYLTWVELLADKQDLIVVQGEEKTYEDLLNAMDNYGGEFVFYEEPNDNGHNNFYLVSSSIVTISGTAYQRFSFVNLETLDILTKDIENDVEDVAEVIDLSNATKTNVVRNKQITFAVIADWNININGKEAAPEYSIDETSTYYEIKYDGAILTTDRAKRYMAFLTGSDYLPVYNFDRPQNTFLFQADGTFLKPQFDEEYGLRLYKMTSPLATMSWVAANYVALTGNQTINGQKTFNDETHFKNRIWLDNSAYIVPSVKKVFMMDGRYTVDYNLPISPSEVDENKVFTLATEDYVDEKIAEAIGDIEDIEKITYADLVELRDNAELVPGKLYRITDYTCVTAQEGTTSAGHDFDIIVRADNYGKLNESAHAIQSENLDVYFSNANLLAWELKYSLDNDADRFAWADPVNGKGVIYYMKDEFGNECPYDFKNILFTKPGELIVYYNSHSLVYERVPTNDTTVGNTAYYAWKYSSTKSATSSSGFANILYTKTLNPTIGETALYVEPDIAQTSYTLKGYINGYVSAYTFHAERVSTIVSDHAEYSNYNKYLRDQSADTETLYAWKAISGPIGSPDAYVYTNTETPMTSSKLYNRAGIEQTWTITSTDLYTSLDASMNGQTGTKCYKNVIKEFYKYDDGLNIQELNFNVFYYRYLAYIVPSPTFACNFYANELDAQCSYNAFFSGDCYGNKMANECSFNGFGSLVRGIAYIYQNTISQAFKYNCASSFQHCVVGAYSSLNYFGTSNQTNFGIHFFSNFISASYSNFGNYCAHNKLGSTEQYISFGNYCQNNIIKYNGCGITFGEYCRYNILGENVQYSTFGSSCSFITFGQDDTTINYVRNVIVENGCMYLNLFSTETSSNYLQNIHIHLGVMGNSDVNRLDLEVPTRDNAYETSYIKTGSIEVSV